MNRRYNKAELIALVRKGLYEGKTVVEIHRESGVPYSTIHRYVSSQVEYYQNQVLCETARKVIYLYRDTKAGAGTIAKELGMTRQGAHYWINKLAGEKRLRVRKPKEGNPLDIALMTELERRVHHLYGKGHSFAEIATIAGISRQRARYIVCKLAENNRIKLRTEHKDGAWKEKRRAEAAERSALRKEADAKRSAELQAKRDGKRDAERRAERRVKQDAIRRAKLDAKNGA